MPMTKPRSTTSSLLPAWFRPARYTFAATGTMTELSPPVSPGVTAKPPVGPVVRYNSRGVLLVIGAAAEAAAAVAGLSSSLRVVIIATDAQSDEPDPAGATVVRGRPVSVSGHLGRFRVMAAGPDGPIDVGPFSTNADGFFDLVLDLSSPPLISTEVVPPGYYAPSGHAARLARALADIPRQLGEVIKPCYVTFRPEICAHARKGNVGCVACLDICPAEAISPAGDIVTVDFHRCLGCATCTAVCPSGALAYAYALPGEIRVRVAALLAERRDSNSSAPVVVFHEANGKAAATDAAWFTAPHDVVLPVAVASLVALGVDTWLATLAGGAASVVAVVPADATRTVRRVLADQAALARQILIALGENEERCRLVAADGAEKVLTAPATRGTTDAAALASGDRRTAFFLAVEALAAATSNGQESIALPADTAFGAIEVDSAACTLCLSCVGACPFEALAAGEQGASLEFVEASCVQCGLCRATCPETAIELVPRLLLDRDARLRRRRLHRGDMAHCAKCGTPFMPQALLEAALSHVAGRAGLAENAMQILRVCPQCRADAVIREDSTIDASKSA